MCSDYVFEPNVCLCGLSKFVVCALKGWDLFLGCFAMWELLGFGFDS